MAALFERDALILVPPNFVKFHISLVFSYLKNFIGLALKIKKFKFWRARLGGPPHRGTPDFRRVSVLLDVYNSSWYDPCAVCGLKGDNDRRKKKEKKIRKIFIQGEINKYDHDKNRK